MSSGNLSKTQSTSCVCHTTFLDRPPTNQFTVIETKRTRRHARGNTIIFQRLEKPLQQAPPTAHLKREEILLLDVFQDQIPKVHTSQPGDEIRDPLALKFNKNKATRRTPLAFQRYVDGKHVFDVQPSNEDRMDLDDAKNFVYDVYVMKTDDTTLGDSKNENINTGTLSIPAGKEAEWLGDDFWEGDEDDLDRIDTDDDDSNAEDYYGADYPDGEEEDFNDDSDAASGEEGYDPEEYHPDYEVDYSEDFDRFEQS